MTQYVGLIGYPLGHSISPPMQQAAFDNLGLDVRYELWETEQDKLSEIVEGIRDSSKLGANVTIPYKEAVIPLLDKLDTLADEIGAVNTIVERDGKLVGFNTDAGGFLKAIRDEASFDPAGKRVVLLGAGGVARAVAFALAGAGARLISITDIEIERTNKLTSDVQQRYNEGKPQIKALSHNSGEFAGAIWECDLLVNCSPIGMKHSDSENDSPIEAALIPKDALVYDVVYNPIETRLLADAKKRGASTLGGLSMLVYQGALAFELWTGKEPPVDIMMSKAKESIS